jgi:adenylate cyclase
VYILAPSPTDPSQLIYVGDADEDPEYLGEVYTYDDASMILLNQHQAFSNRKFTNDQWGLWLSSFAPITDSKGNYVATLAVDINAKIILGRLSKLVMFGRISLAASIALALLVAYLLSRFTTRSLSAIHQGVTEIGEGNLKYEVNLQTKDEFNDLAQAINSMAKGLQERERLKLNFARYVSHQVLEKILQADTSTKLEGERRKVTILFTDIRQFTHLTEHLPAEEVVSLLNEYFDKMFEIILSNFGTLDKFIGDSIMVEFGAPIDDPNQEKHALETAIKMQQELKILCDKWEKEGKPRIEMGIGIHTGLAVVGNIGSEKRMEYTAIGDTVNVASRLEHATKILKKPILVSESTLKHLQDKFLHENLGPITLPGREETITVYAIDVEQKIK